MGRTHAFETTLGGRTMPARIKAAAQSHDVLVWLCGLSSPALHIARVKARVAAGGHAIPEAQICECYPAALENLIGLMPYLAQLHVYDNSVEAASGAAVPDPLLVAEMQPGKLVGTANIETLRSTPEWAKPLLEAARSSERHIGDQGQPGRNKAIPAGRQQKPSSDHFRSPRPTRRQ